MLSYRLTTFMLLAFVSFFVIFSKNRIFFDMQQHIFIR